MQSSPPPELAHDPELIDSESKLFLDPNKLSLSQPIRQTNRDAPVCIQSRPLRSPYPHLPHLSNIVDEFGTVIAEYNVLGPSRALRMEQHAWYSNYWSKSKIGPAPADVSKESSSDGDWGGTDEESEEEESVGVIGKKQQSVKKTSPFRNKIQNSFIRPVRMFLSLHKFKQNLAETPISPRSRFK